jgi:hypothetical protein
MKYGVAMLVALGLLAGCGVIKPNDTAEMPLNKFGGPVMSQNDAIALSNWALKDPATTHNNPELAARAIAAEDWLAGQSMLTPDFGDYAPVATNYWGEYRRDVRSAIGVAPGTPSQVVVDQLLATADALHAHTPNPAAGLQPPAFTLGPDGTLQALANLPAFQTREVAVYDLDRNENRSGGNCSSPVC